jgi:hypothetical protein
VTELVMRVCEMPVALARQFVLLLRQPVVRRQRRSKRFSRSYGVAKSALAAMLG